MYLPWLTHMNPEESPDMPEPVQEIRNFSQGRSVMATKMPELQLRVQKIPPRSSCSLRVLRRAGAAMMEMRKVIQLVARVAGPIPGKSSCSQMWVRMVMQLLKGVNSRKKKILTLTVYYLAPIYNMPHIVYTMLGPILKMAVSGYIAASLAFFAFPSLLHPPIRQPPLFQEALSGKRVLRIAHRGGPHYGMENTMRTFNICRDKVDMIEMDVCETKDGVLVVHHDPSLKRTCGVDRPVGECLLSELPPFQDQVQMHFSDGGIMKTSEEDRIPTLEAVFKAYPNLPMDIQIKTPSSNAIGEIKRLIHKYNRVDITLVGIVAPLEKDLKESFPEGSRFFCYGSIPKLVLLYLSGLLPFFKIEQKALQIPLFTQDYQAMRNRAKGPGLANRLYFCFLRGSYYLFRPLVWHLRRRGVMTFYWVCNREEEVERAVRGQGCGVMSDDPQMLNRVLGQKGRE